MVEPAFNIALLKIYIKTANRFADLKIKNLKLQGDTKIHEIFSMISKLAFDIACGE